MARHCLHLKNDSTMSLLESAWQNVCASKKHVRPSSNVPSGQRWNQVNLLKPTAAGVLGVCVDFRRRMDSWMLWMLVIFSVLLWILLATLWVSSWNLKKRGFKAWRWIICLDYFNILQSYFCLFILSFL